MKASISPSDSKHHWSNTTSTAQSCYSNSFSLGQLCPLAPSLIFGPCLHLKDKSDSSRVLLVSAIPILKYLNSEVSYVKTKWDIQHRINVSYIKPGNCYGKNLFLGNSRPALSTPVALENGTFVRCQETQPISMRLKKLCRPGGKRFCTLLTHSQCTSEGSLLRVISNSHLVKAHASQTFNYFIILALLNYSLGTLSTSSSYSWFTFQLAQRRKKSWKSSKATLLQLVQ